jgi:hypothetical protein
MHTENRVALMQRIRAWHVKEDLNRLENARSKIPEVYRANAERIEQLLQGIFSQLYNEGRANFFIAKMHVILDLIFYRGRPSKARIKLVDILRNYNINALCEAIRDFEENMKFSETKKKPTVKLFLGYVRACERKFHHNPKSIRAYQSPERIGDVELF